jgi:hypothetical protein
MRSYSRSNILLPMTVRASVAGVAHEGSFSAT